MLNRDNHRISLTQEIDTDSPERDGESAFYDPTNPVLAPAKEVTTTRKKSWKRRLITWTCFLVLLIAVGFALYSMLRIRKVDVKVSAESRPESAVTKTAPSPAETESGLSAEAINIARDAMGSDTATANGVAPSPSPSVAPDSTSATDTKYSPNYSATMDTRMGSADDLSKTSTASSAGSTSATQRSSKSGDESSQGVARQSRANTTQSILVDDALQNPAALSAQHENARRAARLQGKTDQADRIADSPAVLPPFGTMLPVRTQAVVFTISKESYARLELTRQLSGEGWSLPKGTVLIGRTAGSQLDRAFVNVIGYLDPRENRFVKMSGEVLGSDGASGLKGKRVSVDRNSFKRTLRKVASSGLQIASAMAGALTGGGTVVLGGSGYRLLNPLSDEAGRLVNGDGERRSFVRVEAGQSAYVMVADLPKELHAVDAPGEYERSGTATSLTDREVMELILFGTPEDIRGAVPLMNDQQRAMVVKTLKAEGKP
jgi:hypothetical protein